MPRGTVKRSPGCISTGGRPPSSIRNSPSQHRNSSSSSWWCHGNSPSRAAMRTTASLATTRSRGSNGRSIPAATFGIETGPSMAPMLGEPTRTRRVGAVFERPPRYPQSMSLYRLSEPDQLVAPAIVAAFDGWIDAAGASTAATVLVGGDGEAVASFDPDALYDYRSRRPVLDVLDGKLTELVWPDLTLKRARHGPRDLLVLTGPEPDFRWRELSQDVLEIALKLGVVEWVSLGAIPAAVPHTRPVPILATASKQGLLAEEEQQGPEGLLRVPSAALSTIELAVSSAGLPAVGFYAQVPHYVGGPFASATIGLLEHAGRHLGVELPLGALPDEAMAQRQRLDQAVADSEESREYVQRLEQMADEQGQPSGEDLVSEIERFLQQGGAEGGPGPRGER